jgi:tRNA A37 threonylcarbamoyladenosine modification protein TsaB
MIKNFLIISCIGSDDKLGLRINKDFFIKKFKNNKAHNESLVNEISNFLKSHNLIMDEKFSVIVNQGPGSFSGIRISLAVAKGLKISKKVRLYGYKNNDLKQFNQENIEILLKKNLIEKKLIKPIYLS